MGDELKRTVRIRKPRVETDERGRTIWTGPVETAEFELLSTAVLTKMIDSGDEARKQRLRQVAQQKDGIVARETVSREFQIIDDDDLKAALDSAGGAEAESKPGDVVLEQVSLGTEGEPEFSLVSTQALRRMLDADESSDDDRPDAEQGFDPYNRT